MRPKELQIVIDVSDLSLIEAEQLWGTKNFPELVREIQAKPSRDAKNVLISEDET
jgi:hypothetical protein